MEKLAQAVEFGSMSDHSKRLLVPLDEYRKMENWVADVIGINGERLHYNAGSDMVEHNGDDYCLCDNEVIMVGNGADGVLLVLRPLGVEKALEQMEDAVTNKKSGQIIEIWLNVEHRLFGQIYRAKTVFEKDGRFYVNKRKCHSGYGIGTILDKIVRIRAVDDNKKPYDFEKDMERVRRATHPNLRDWVENKDGGIRKLGEYNGRFKTRNIRRLFQPHIIEQLREAIEQKKDYKYTKHGERRDYSLSVKNCKDGILRAWFSSEYSGCGNGNYYILINPTTALFVETD